MNHQDHLHAFNDNYKACIIPQEMPGKPLQYEVCVYRWSEEADDEGKPLWERIAGPFVVDEQIQAQDLAQAQLALFTGEEKDLSVPPGLYEEASTLLGSDPFAFFKPEAFEVLFIDELGDENPLEIEVLLSTGDLYFARQEESWFTGFLERDQIIHCFHQSESLEQAISQVQDLDEKL